MASPDMHARLCLLSVLLASGCTTVIPPPQVDPPLAWAQKPEEFGMLPAGKVMAVRVEQFDDTTRLALKGHSTTIVIRGAFVQLPSASTGLSTPFKRAQQFYRYSVQRKGMVEPEYWDDFVVYAIGSCVAFREKQEMVVPALVRECEW